MMNRILTQASRPRFYNNIHVFMLRPIYNGIITRLCSSEKQRSSRSQNPNFEIVFSFPTIKYIALLNRLKVYHIIGTSIVVPSCGIMDILNMVESGTFLISAYIGLTGIAVLTLGTYSFKNIIGHLYISDDNKYIKISSLDFWGKRIDRIITVDEWTPLLGMKPKPMDALFLKPQLTDGTVYTLPVRFGKVYDSQKMGQVLE